MMGRLLVNLLLDHFNVSIDHSPPLLGIKSRDRLNTFAKRIGHRHVCLSFDVAVRRLDRNGAHARVVDRLGPDVVAVLFGVALRN